MWNRPRTSALIPIPALISKRLWILIIMFRASENIFVMLKEKQSCHLRHSTDHYLPQELKVFDHRSRSLKSDGGAKWLKRGQITCCACAHKARDDVIPLNFPGFRILDENVTAAARCLSHSLSEIRNPCNKMRREMETNRFTHYKYPDHTSHAKWVISTSKVYK